MHKAVARQTIVVCSDPGVLGIDTNLCLGNVNINCIGLENYPHNSISTPGFKHLFACNEFMHTFARNIPMNVTRIGDSVNTMHSITLYKDIDPGCYVLDSKHNLDVCQHGRTRPMNLFGSLFKSWF